MVKTTSANLSSRQREVILDSAKKRLDALGFENVTMLGIAKELSVSKATLYYYFSGREGLLTEVIAREEEKYFRTLELRMRNIKAPEDKLAGVVQLMNDFCREFTSLNRLRLSGNGDLPACYGERFANFHDRELALVIGILEECMLSGHFRKHDPKENAVVFLDVLNGLRLLANTNKEGSATLENKQRIFLRIFSDSLRK